MHLERFGHTASFREFEIACVLLVILVDETGIEPATFPVKPGRSPMQSGGEGLSVD